MGLLADLYISTDDEAPLYDATQPLPDSDRIETNSLTTLELSTLWAILQGREWDVSMMDEFQCLLIEDEGERLVHRLPDNLVSRLATCNSETLSHATAKWAQTDELSCEASVIQPFIQDLVRLARRAQETGKSVYLWNCV